MCADIHDGQERTRSIQGPDTEAQDQPSPDHHIQLATHGRSIQKCQECVAWPRGTRWSPRPLASTCPRRCSRVLTRSLSKARTSGLARTLEALALTVPAGTYNIVDDEPLTKRAYADALAAAAGKRVS